MLWRGSSAVLLVLVATACGGPVGPLAGGRLVGTPYEAPVQDWDFARSYDLMEIETRPDDPYSVKVHYYVVAGDLYVEGGSNGWSRWRSFLHEDPRAQVRFGETVYPVRAVEVTDPAEIAAVLPRFYEKDRDEPTAACQEAWSVEVCAFEGRFYRLESRPGIAADPSSGLVVGDGP